ncbi:DNA mismatch repair protein MutS [Pannonibacter phragmitetus]|uniref:Smr/MutS family protein n=1 Tax=Pannonibacter TaxID=227873 RepID=UPI00067BE3FC|nr:MULTISPECIES: Smr/MutS family protein [Pannonibacter]KND18542.1 DNA mismatch repair protein MutS [Pannonibacter phragmitetus]MBA4207151.1 endonuclease SmrB [Polymorphum sp.]
MSGRRGRNKGLSTEDRQIWSKVAATLTPLKTTRPLEPDPDLEHELSLAEEMARAGIAMTGAGQDAGAPETAIRSPAQPKGPPPLAPLERRVRQKIVRGMRSFDARIDLHGLTQHEAHDRLRGFLHLAYQRGHVIVLVITGKGGRNGPGSGHGAPYMDERGILRRVVPQWLAMADLRHIVLGFEEAHLTHGGSGALYVRLRKRKA